MPDYLCLLYAEDGDADVQAERWARLPEWDALANELRDAGLLIDNNALSPATSTTTVRVRGEEVALTDGPFAVTKETLVGYFVLRCRDHDQALACAQRFPNAAYGAVQVHEVWTARR